MKKLKPYLIIFFILFTTSSIFLACSGDDTAAQQTEQSTKKESLNNTSTKKELQITTGTIKCHISGSTVFNVNTNDAYSLVSAGATTALKYNSDPTVSNVVWSIVPGTVIPAGSLTITGSGTTANITTAANFLGGSIQAIGTDSNGQTCGPVLPIKKATGTNGDCCTPTLELSYICRGGSLNLGGFLTLVPPRNCTMDWNTKVSKIDFKLEGGPVFSTDDALNGTRGGALYPPFTNLYNDHITLEFNKTGCASRVTTKVTIYFNNGCPPIYLNADASQS